ncbi:MAG: hypothetical protein HYS38_04595 [Acidobacteria bacterium]|nr:hypothetical protein [Acidobacteriota bacterium]
MGILRKIFAPRPIDVLAANLFMEYRPLTRTGSAAVQWLQIASPDPNLKPFLIALLYGRILYINTETRTKLFWTIDELAKQNVRDEGRTGFLFPDWALDVGFGVPPQTIWPWDLYESPGALSKPKIYKATLQSFQAQDQAGYFGIHLTMAFGQDRILAPASLLIAITSYLQSTDQEGCYELAVLLWQINEFYRSPDTVRLGSETEALQAATAAIRMGNLSVP